MKTLNKERIKESFSRAAVTYDEAVDFQKETGRGLIDLVLLDKGSKDVVLDAGMGTGAVTRELYDGLDRHSRVYGCDIAWGMVSFSKRNTRNIFINQADTESLPYKNEVFDIVFSNITYHWLNDFKSAFSEVRRVLKNGGRFYFSILIKDSLKELDKILEVVLEKPYAKNFLSSAEYIKSTLVESNLEVIWYQEKALKRYYKSSLDLIKAMKKVGANVILEPNLFGMGKRRLFFKMIDAYDQTFNETGRVFATYNVMMGCAKKS